MTGKLRLGKVVVVEELRSADSRPRVGAFTITDAVVREFTLADWVEVGRQLGAEEVMVEFDARARSHLVFGAALDDGVHLILKLPVESPTPKEGEQ